MKFDRIVTIVLLVIVVGTAVALILSLGSPGMGTGTGTGSVASDLSGFPGGIPTGGQGAQGAQGAAQTASVNVQVMTMEPTTFMRTMRAYGELVRTSDPWSVFSDVTGTVTSMLVTRGDKVAQGDVIAIVDPSTAGTQYKERSVIAKTAGIVESTTVKIGSHVVAYTTQLAVLVDPDDLVLELSLPERYLSLVDISMNATFNTTAWPEQSFAATVSYLAPEIDSETRTFDVELLLEPDSRLQSGMFVQVDLVTEVLEKVLVVPAGTVSTYLGQPCVYIAKDGYAKRVNISIGSSSDSHVVVMAGLTAGDQVVTAGSVVDGSAITILEGGRT